MTVEMLIGGFLILMMVAGIVVSMTSNKTNERGRGDWKESPERGARSK